MTKMRVVIMALFGVAPSAVADDGGYMATMQMKADAWTEYVENHQTAGPEYRGPHECVDGMAGPYPCENVDLVALVTAEYIGETYMNDIWGWTDAAYDGHEYVIQGTKTGTVFIDISMPTDPVIVGWATSASACSCPDCWWRDIRTVGDYAYIVSENEGHGIQAVDMTQLRDRADTIRSLSSRRLGEKRRGRGLRFGYHHEDPVEAECRESTVEYTSVFDHVSDSHNIVAFSEADQAEGASPIVVTVGTDDEETAHWYNQRGHSVNEPDTANGDVCGGGLAIFDVGEDPAMPKYLGCHGTSHTHDAQCIIYRGPDEEHYGKEICIASNENHIDVVDMSVLYSPKSISKLYGCGGDARTIAPEPYPAVECDATMACPPGGPCPNWKPSYAHQGWMTADHRYFIMDDETDELDGFPTDLGYSDYKKVTVQIFDMTDLDAPFLVDYDVKDYDGVNHNIFVKGDLVFRVDYENGLKIENATGAPDGALPEIGFFDTDPGADDGYDDAETGPPFSYAWGGSWGTYVYFPSGLIVASSNGVAPGTFILNYTGPM